MRDLTQGAIWRHLVGIGMFMAMGLLVQTLYLLVDLYFVARLGKEAVAGVAAAGSSTLITMSIAQIVGVGSLSLVSHAVGRKDQADAQLIFEQALLLGLAIAGAFLLIGYCVGAWALKQISADPETAAQGRIFLFAFLPSLATMFPGAAMGSALRASGVVRSPMMLQAGAVLLNIALAPILIMGWGTGHPLGVMGAGLASSIASILGGLGLALLFNRAQNYMRLHGSLRPRLAVWRRIVAIGFPATGEFALIFITTAVAYWAIRGFGPQAQAGYGIGSRIMQAIFLPAIAVARATAPIAGQNFGARNAGRVRDTFRHAALMGAVLMLTLTLLCQVSPSVLVAPFSNAPEVLRVAAELLRISSWNFLAMGLIFCCSGMFQALGDTRPALLSSGSRLLTYVIPALWLSAQPWAALHHFWYLSVASVTIQATASFLLLKYHLNRRLALFAAESSGYPR